jgi:phosphatidylinositol kinase/protein kinase (PI-3  family)
MITRLLSSLLKKEKSFQSFTYYIPSPPERKAGYQEKHFDQIVNYVLEHNYKINQLNCTPNTQQKHSGMWVILVLECDKKNALKYPLTDLLKKFAINSEDASKDEIPGLYYINDFAGEIDS